MVIMDQLKKVFDYLDSRKKRIIVFSAVLLIVILLFNGFYGLSSGVIRNWDESLYGISACEMLDNGNYIAHTLDYTVDYWNLKPVLAFYGNLAGFAIFGKNIFGLRFFSVAAYLLIAGMIFLARFGAEPVARSSNRTVLVDTHRHPDGRRTVFVSNLHASPQTTRLTLFRDGAPAEERDLSLAAMQVAVFDAESAESAE